MYFLPYSSGRHRRFETVAKEVLKRLVATWGSQVLPNDDPRVVAEIRRRLNDPNWQSTSADLYVTDLPTWNDAEERVVLLELETRKDYHFSALLDYYQKYASGMRDMDTQYDNVHVPYRKELNGNISDLYVGMNKSCTTYFLIGMDVVHRFAQNDPVLQNSSDNEGGTVEDEPYTEIPNRPRYVEYFDVPEGCGLTPLPEDWLHL